MKFRQRQLKYLEPDINGMIIIKSSKDYGAKFYSFVTYEKAIILVKEGAAKIENKNTITKIMSKKQMKNYILKRDNYVCHYCGEHGDTVDHKIPRSKGGCSTPINLVCCCYECNQKKLTMDYDDFIKLTNNLMIKAGE